MSQLILVTGAAGGQQGSTGRLVAVDLLKQDIPVRAFVHKLDNRSDELSELGAEIVAGDLLNPGSVHAAMTGVTRAYFSYPVQDGLLEAATIFAASAAGEKVEFVVNNSQFQDTPEDSSFRDIESGLTYRNLQHRLSDRIFDWSGVKTAHIQAPPYYENVRVLVRRGVIEQDTAFLPWGEGDGVFPLAGAVDVARVAATLLASSSIPVAGPYSLVSEVLTAKQIVETIGKAIGRPIRYVPITDEQWASASKERINAHALDHLSRLWAHFRSNTQPRKATNTVQEVTGQAPQTLEDFFRANADVFAAAKS